MNKLTALVILDGWGIGTKREWNAIANATMPNITSYLENYPSTTLKCSGLDVGLPPGQMGNSEVGHLNIGAGRIVYQELTRITKEIGEGDFFKNPAFVKVIEKVKASSTKLHLMGLLSDGGVHSHNTHIYALLELAKRMELEEVYIHCFMDGRDVAPSSGIGYIEELEEKIKEIGVGKIATVSGRYYSMDRDKRWERVAQAYYSMTKGEGLNSESAYKAMENSYKEGITDEFIKPTVIDGVDGRIQDGDGIIFFNFRPDRARQITRAIVDKDFDGFEREKHLDTTFVSMTQYDVTIENVDVAYKPQTLDYTLGQYLSEKGINQLRIAETEKYAHVTFFFNGGIEKAYQGEDRILIPSPKVATYDLQPQMSALEVTDTVVSKIEEELYSFIVLNFANLDMVGHTGNYEATIRAAETVDMCIKRVVDAVMSRGGNLIVTSDHGNAETMYDEDSKGPHTAHTTNDVNCIVMGLGDIRLREGRLADVAPTILDIMGLPVPVEMTGKSLIVRK